MSKLQAFSIAASADYLGNGAIEVNQYESDITDIVRRESPMWSRLAKLGRIVKATGHPHRYIEQLAIGSATSSDPRMLSPTPTGPSRQERSAMLKGVTTQTVFTHFDSLLAQAQKDFSEVEAQDIADIAAAIAIRRGEMLWYGNDTSLTLPATLEYMGLLRQLLATSTVGGMNGYTAGNPVNASMPIIDSIKTAVSKVLAQKGFNARPSVIACNPLLADAIDQEAKANAYHMDKIEFVGGVQVNAIMTQAGVLPIFSDPFMPVFDDTHLAAHALPLLASQIGSAANPPTVAYPIAILTEGMIEIPSLTKSGTAKGNPMVLEVGKTTDLQKKFVGVSYDAVIAKGVGYAHTAIVAYR